MFRPLFASLVALGFLTIPSAALLAQNETELPEAEDVDIQTKDGVVLRATLYKGTKGRESVPIVMLHSFEGDRNDFHDLALFLQGQSHMVLVPDLRGHGESTKVNGTTKRLEADKMPAAQFARMVLDDMESIKRWLRERHNNEELNLNKLCIIGSEMGAVVAYNWTAVDWSITPLVTGKQGQWVKALALLSPKWTFKGLKINEAVNHPLASRAVAMYLAVGEQDAGALRDATRLFNSLEKYHPIPTEENDFRSLLLYEVDTSLQGTEMFEANDPVLAQGMAQFIEFFVGRASIPWKKIKDPFSTSD